MRRDTTFSEIFTFLHLFIYFISTAYFSTSIFFNIHNILFFILLGESTPVKMFERAANLANNQIINYRCDPSEKWLILIGIAPGTQEVSG